MIHDTLFELFGFIPVTAVSILDLLIVTLIIYRLLTLIRGHRGAHMLVGLFLLVSVALAARWREKEMMAVAWMLEQVQSILLILLVILFQPELRRVLLAIGQSPLLSWFYKTEPSRVIDEVVNGSVQLAERGYGALIVLAREAGLGAIIESGAPLNAQVSADLQARRYASGVAGYTDYLDALRTLLGVQSTLSAAGTELALARLAVHRALGGGWTTIEATP